jgi:hypothetical protein
MWAKELKESHASTFKPGKFAPYVQINSSFCGIELKTFLLFGTLRVPYSYLLETKRLSFCYRIIELP